MEQDAYAQIGRTAVEAAIRLKKRGPDYPVEEVDRFINEVFVVIELWAPQNWRERHWMSIRAVKS